MQSLTFSMPQRIIFGVGVFEQLKDEVEYFQAKRILFICDRPSDFAIEESLDKDIEIETFSSFDGEPTLEIVNQCLVAAKDFEADLCLGIGGGSVIDVAKVVAWAKGNNCSVVSKTTDYTHWGRGITTIMIPTTNGTGSEATPNALFLDEKRNKHAIISRYIIPHVAIIDPALTASLPSKLNTLTNIDALSHCLESYLSTNGSKWSREFALKGIITGYRSIEKSLEFQDTQARIDLATTSLFGGIALTNAGTSSVHALAYPLAKYKLTHSQSVALLYSAVIYYHIKERPNLFKELYYMLNHKKEEMNQNNLIQVLIKPVLRVLNKANLPISISQQGLSEDIIPLLTEEAFLQERLLKNNPIPLTKDDIKKIYELAFNVEKEIWD